MTTPNTNVTFSSIQTEFGGSNPIALDEYYAGGGYVATGVTGVPTSGTISVDNLRNKSQIVYGTLTPNISSEAEGAVITVTFNLTGVTGVPNGTTLYWKIDGTGISASDFNENTLTGSFTLNVTGGVGSGSFTITPIGDNIIEGTETFYAHVGTAAGVPTSYVNSTGVNITETQTYSINWDNPNIIFEGQTRNINLATYNVTPGGITYYYVIQQTGAQPISASGDISPMSGTLGTLTVSSSPQAVTPSATLTFTNDGVYENAYETFSISIRAGSTSGTEVCNSGVLTILDTPSYSLSWSPSSISEGGYSTLTLSTSNVPTSSTYYYTLSGSVTSADMPGIFGASSITTSGGSSATSHGSTFDGVTEGTETLTVNLYGDAGHTNFLTSSNTLSISDATGSISSASTTGWGTSVPIYIYAQITYIAPYVSDRYFEVWGNYGSGVYRVTYPGSTPLYLYVPAGQTYSANTLMYYAASATAYVSYYLELRLTGHNTFYFPVQNGYI